MKSIATNNLTIQKGTCALQVGRVRAVLHPAIGRHVGLPHHCDSTSYGILKIGFGTANPILGYRHPYFYQQRTMIGRQRLIDHPGRVDNKSRRFLFQSNQVVERLLRFGSRISGLLRVGKYLECTLQIFDKAGVGIRVEVTGKEERFPGIGCNGLQDFERLHLTSSVRERCVHAKTYSGNSATSSVRGSSRPGRAKVCTRSGVSFESIPMPYFPPS